MPELQLGDNKIIAFSRAITRSEQILTGALMTNDSDDYDRWTAWATAIADEWDFAHDLRIAVLNAANENATLDRNLGFEYE